MDIMFFIFMIVIAGIFLFFDYKESKKGRHKNRYKLFAFRTIIITVMILLTFQLFGNQVTYNDGITETHYYKADNVTLDYITKDPIKTTIPFSRELAVIFLMLVLYLTYWISDTFNTNKSQSFGG